MDSTTCSPFPVALRMPLVTAGIIKRGKEASGSDSEEFVMFDGKNNNMLDSFSFRFVVTAGVFIAWFIAGYMVLAA